MFGWFQRQQPRRQDHKNTRRCYSRRYQGHNPQRSKCPLSLKVKARLNINNFPRKTKHAHTANTVGLHKVISFVANCYKLTETKKMHWCIFVLLHYLPHVWLAPVPTTTAPGSQKHMPLSQPPVPRPQSTTVHTSTIVSVQELSISSGNYVNTK